MSSPYQAFFSNHVEQLYQHLKIPLFAGEPFARKFIVVPSAAMRGWLQQQLAQDPAIGIAAGLEICSLDQAIHALCQLMPQSNAYQPTQFDIALAIEAEIRHQITQPVSEIRKPLFDYLHVQHQSLSRKGERRLVNLSASLASHFVQYGKYGGRLLTEWETASQAASTWQVALWGALFGKEGRGWTTPYHLLHQKIQSPSLKLSRRDVQVHLFGLSFISHLHHHFFMRLAADIPVRTYILSPCQLFWSDQLSHRESRQLQAFWQKKNASEEQQHALEEYLRECHPLLANFGRLGREMAQQIEESEMETIEDYKTSEHPSTLLEAVQTDMALLRTPDPATPTAFTEELPSIQIHIAPSKQREVDILYNALCEILQRHSQDSTPLYPRDVIVMAPNIADYAPYIRTRFGSSDSLLPFQLMDLNQPTQHTLILGFLRLLRLPLQRWDTLSLFALFECPAFQRRHQLERKSLHHLRNWIEAADIRWGADSAHRNELLQRDHCAQGMVDENAHGTWEHGFGRLLSGLVFDEQTAPHASLEQVETTEAPLLGCWMHILRSLRSDLRRLADGTQLTLAQWIDTLQNLYEKYFSANGEDQEAVDLLLAQFAEWRRSPLANTLYPFDTLYHHLKHTLEQSTDTHTPYALNSVRFCSLLPMRAVPAKIIVMLGMSEGAFPRHEGSSSLNLMQHSVQADYSPSPSDYDRFLFLETFLSAERYLLITYCGVSSDDGKEQPPSLVIDELLSYLDRAYLVNDRKPSQNSVHHPAHAFDPRYFSGDRSLRSYIPRHFSAAQAYTHQDKISSENFFSSFAIKIEPVSLPLRLSLKTLTAMARHPIKSYFNQTLGIYIDKTDKRLLKTEEDFHLSELQKYLIRQDMLHTPLDTLLQQAEREGKLPLGAFKQVAIDTLKQELETLHRSLHSVGVNTREIGTISLQSHCQTPQQNATGWQLPPLRIPYRDQEIEITGELPTMSPQGLIASMRNEKVDIFKIWPQFLALNCIANTYSLPVKPHLINVVSEKAHTRTPLFTDPHKELAAYLDYYFTALHHPSPLMPQWIPSLLKDAPSLQRKIKERVESDFSHDDYLKWNFETKNTDVNEMIAHWQPKAKALFQDMHNSWFKDRGEKSDS